jgi:acetoin utilization protein AcuC
MRGKLVYPWSEDLLKYEFREDHPLKPERLKLTYILSKELGLIDKVQVTLPDLATREELELIHSPDFIEAVQETSATGEANVRYGLGTPDNPAFKGIYETGARYVGATLDAMKAIINGASNAFCISGGLHHAQRSEASGFCIFNDVAISIEYFLKRKKKARVLYVDVDAHHGDGVQNAFYRSKDVMTISTHQTGRTLFPGTGFVYETGGAEGVGYSVNVPVIPGAGSKELIHVFEEVIEPLFKAFRPNLLVTQLGVDGHYMDPLAHLAYTSYGYETVLKGLKKLSDDICDVGWLAVGGGGYHVVNVARLWTLFLGIMLDEEVPDALPPAFLELCSQRGYDRCPTTIRDPDEVVQMYFSREEVELDLERTLRRIKELIFPYHGL